MEYYIKINIIIIIIIIINCDMELESVTFDGPSASTFQEYDEVAMVYEGTLCYCSCLNGHLFLPHFFCQKEIKK